MPQLKFSLSTRSVNGVNEIYCRFTAERGRDQRARTGLFVRPERWNKNTGCIAMPRFNSDEHKTLRDLQCKLDELTKQINDEYVANPQKFCKGWLQNLLEKNTQKKTRRYRRKTIVEEVKPTSLSQYDFVDFYEEYTRRSNTSAVYKNQCFLIMDILKRFSIYTNTELTWFNITSDFLQKFEDYLRNEYKIIKRHGYLLDRSKSHREIVERSDNDIATKMRKIRWIINAAIKEEIITVSPFNKYTPPQEVYGTPYFLTIEERNKIYEHDLSDNAHLAIQRDIFIFQCLVGCRVGDLLSLQKSNINNGYLEYVPKKTSRSKPTVLRVPLTPVAQTIIERYKDNDSTKLLPFICSQRYNDAIKEILWYAGIDRLVNVRNAVTGRNEQFPLYEVASSHMARRTFCGNLYKKVKDARLVGSMSGHVAGSKAFERYSTIDDEMKNEMLDLIK